MGYDANLEKMSESFRKRTGAPKEDIKADPAENPEMKDKEVPKEDPKGTSDVYTSIMEGFQATGEALGGGAVYKAIKKVTK